MKQNSPIKGFLLILLTGYAMIAIWNMRNKIHIGNPCIMHEACETVSEPPRNEGASTQEPPQGGTPKNAQNDGAQKGEEGK